MCLGELRVRLDVILLSLLLLQSGIGAPEQHRVQGKLRNLSSSLRRYFTPESGHREQKSLLVGAFLCFTKCIASQPSRIMGAWTTKRGNKFARDCFYEATETSSWRGNTLLNVAQLSPLSWAGLAPLKT